MRPAQQSAPLPLIGAGPGRWTWSLSLLAPDQVNLVHCDVTDDNPQRTLVAFSEFAGTGARLGDEQINTMVKTAVAVVLLPVGWADPAMVKQVEQA